ncbi:MAG TPA: hypothetical protein DCG53_10705, partial [Syntrophus sp. (in: bacteria)]|nr:hypothetical protein [Syntrophus sp. (in: bacteria)]
SGKVGAVQPISFRKLSSPPHTPQISLPKLHLSSRCQQKQKKVEWIVFTGRKGEALNVIKSLVANII